VASSCENGNETCGLINVCNYLEQVSDYKLLKKNSDTWICIFIAKGLIVVYIRFWITVVTVHTH
jgi:hypothetical protein